MRFPVAAGAVCAALLAGCGGGGQGSSFAAAAQRFCSQQEVRGANVRDGDLGPALRAFARQEAAAVDRLERAALPTGDRRADARAFVAGAGALERTARAMARSAHEGPLGTAGAEIVPSAASSRRLGRAVRRLGIHGCDSSDPTDAPQPRLAVATPAGLSAGERSRFAAGRRVTTQAGCLACHRIGAEGNDGPGGDLSSVGRRLGPAQIARVLRNPKAPMPAFRNLPPRVFAALVTFLARLR